MACRRSPVRARLAPLKKAPLRRGFLRPWGYAWGTSVDTEHEPRQHRQPEHLSQKARDGFGLRYAAQAKLLDAQEQDATDEMGQGLQEHAWQIEADARAQAERDALHASAYARQAEQMGGTVLDAETEYVDEHGQPLTLEQASDLAAQGYDFVDEEEPDDDAEADAAVAEMLDWLDADPDEFAATVAALPADQQKELITTLQTLGVEVQ